MDSVVSWLVNFFNATPTGIIWNDVGSAVSGGTVGTDTTSSDTGDTGTLTQAASAAVSGFTPYAVGIFIIIVLICAVFLLKEFEDF